MPHGVDGHRHSNVMERTAIYSAGFMGLVQKQEGKMIDYASKDFIRGVSSERIRLGCMDMKRRKARELLAIILTDNWRYSRRTDVARTFQRNTELP